MLTGSSFNSPLVPIYSLPTVLPFVAFQVVVCESHDTPGGAAHAWTVPAPGGGLYHLESGPSLYSGQACLRRKDGMLLIVLAAGVVWMTSVVQQAGCRPMRRFPCPHFNALQTWRGGGGAPTRWPTCSKLWGRSWIC